MTAKQFFKSNVFKCIIALLCVLLVSGIFLTVAYGFLEVTDGERLQRAVSKVYPDVTVTIYGLDENGNEKIIDAKEKQPKSLVSEKVTVDNSEITDVYKIVYKENGADVLNYLVQSTGKGGYSGGSVTCWVAVEMDSTGNISGIGKVTIASNSGQSFIGKITGSFLDSFSTGYTDDVYYSTLDGYVSTGASLSSNAICNAVNSAIEYVKSEILGVGSVNKFEGFGFMTYLDANGTETPTINTKVSDFTVNSDNSVTYTLVTGGNIEAGSFKLEITVGSDKTVKDYKIITNGSTAGYGTDYKEYVYDVSGYVGKSCDYFTSLVGGDGDLKYSNLPAEGDFITGATHSNFICLCAGAFATGNYDKCIAAQSQGGAEQ